MRDQDVVEVLYKGLTIVNTLLSWAGRTVSRRDLAEKTGLEPKQVGRYLNTLEALGFPLKWQRRGTEDMVAMERNVQKRLRLLPFTTEELTALHFYTSLASYVHDTTPLGHLHTAGQKIATFLQHDLQPGRQLSGAFLAFAKHYKVYGTPQTQDVLHSLIPALLESRVCDVTYKTPTADTARSYRIHPYTLCLYHGGLYLFAYRPEQETLMVLSVERICTIDPDNTSFIKDPTILQHIEARRQRAFGIIDDDEAFSVTLKFTAAQAPYVRERVWHPSQCLEEQEDGSLLLQFQASGEFEIMRWILGWGSEVEVIEPPALRQALAQRLQAAAQQYAGDDGQQSEARETGA
jgi:predicted DNA-binding transcriptional regulator YafY